VRFLIRARQGRVTSPPRAAVTRPVEPNPRALVDAPEIRPQPGATKPTVGN
jgi:hypothetical protein